MHISNWHTIAVWRCELTLQIFIHSLCWLIYKGWSFTSELLFELYAVFFLENIKACNSHFAGIGQLLLFIQAPLSGGSPYSDPSVCPSVHFYVPSFVYPSVSQSVRPSVHSFIILSVPHKSYPHFLLRTIMISYFILEVCVTTSEDGT